MKKSTMALVCAVGLLLALLFIHPGSSPAHVESSHFSVYQPTVFSFHLRVYAVVGKPTISAAFINRVLATYHSPAAGLGQQLYDLGVNYGIDPIYALAFFMRESLFGTSGEARKTLSLGNERCIPDRPCIDLQLGGYALMNGWEDGFAHWYRLIRTLYVDQWHLVTIDQIIPVYAPQADHNDVAGYIQAVKRAVDGWRSGAVMA